MPSVTYAGFCRQSNPHQLLRESKEILVSGGHLIILGFNPYSCWGGRKLFSRRKAPWNGHNFSVYKIRDWLSLLDFQITGGMMLYYSPLIKNQAMRQRFSFMEEAGDRWWPMLGSVYLLVAQKRDPGTTVIDFREHFKEDAYMNVAEPAIKSYLKY
jgi:SAM-dependent methyltransferase